MISFFDGLLRDFHHALRGLIRRRSTTLLLLVSVALGIGVSTATFSVVDAVLIKSLPYRDPDRLVMVWNVNQQEGIDVEQARLGGRSMSGPEFLDWQEKSGVFERMVAFGGWFGTIREEENPETFFGYQCTPGVFPLLGVQPYLGRPFLAEEENGEGDPALVLLYEFWQRRFQGDPSVVGQTLRLENGHWRIAGVMPPGFVFFNRQIEVLATLQPQDDQWWSAPRTSRYRRVMARLKPGMSLRETQVRADVFARNLAREYPETNMGWSPQLFPVAEDASGEIRPGMLALLVAVGFVLAILCANLANLLLVQATVRSKELSVHRALGAGRWRIVRRLLTESTTIALAGGVAGLALSWVMIRYFQTSIPDRYTWGKYLVQAEAIQMDWRVAAFGLLAAVVTGLVCGTLPGLHVTRASFHEELKDVGRGSVGARRGQRIRNLLVVGEFALAVVLVIGAALLVRSFLALQQQGSGFNSSNVLGLSVWMPTEALREQTKGMAQEERRKVWNAASISFRDRLTHEFLGIPGVKAVTHSASQPMSAYYNMSEFEVEGETTDARSEALTAIWNGVEPNFFDVVGLPLLDGRNFGIEDRPGGRSVAIVSELAARRFWPGKNPIGKRFKWRNDSDPDPWVTVIGVCGDIREDGLHKPPKPYVYTSLAQYPWGGGWYFLKVAGAPYSVLGSVEKAVRQVDPQTIIYRPRTLDDLERDSTWQLNYSMLLLSGLAWLALLMALIGVYGVMSYSVRERTWEIGVRMTLGAQQRDIMRLVLGQALRLAAVGTAIGLVCSLGSTRFLSSLLYGVEPVDPWTYALVLLSLLWAALAASYFPARRAAKVDPMAALRYE